MGHGSAMCSSLPSLRSCHIRVRHDVAVSGATVLWGELTSEEIGRAGREGALAILPLGCTEQHAGHLPVDTDTYQAERLARDGARRAAERFGVKVLVLPALPFGPASEHAGYPGTIDVPNEVWTRVLRHVLGSVIDSGFTRAAVLRGCTAHWAASGTVWDLVAEEARAGRSVTLRILNTDADWRALGERFPAGSGGHAGAMETSLCLAERGDLVRAERMSAPALRGLRERYVDGGEAFLFRDMTDTGALGDPSAATADAGREIWERTIQMFAERLRLLEEQDRALGRLATPSPTS